MKTKNEVKYMPTPWKFTEVTDKQWAVAKIYVDEDEFNKTIIGDGLREEDAEFIVRAVNSHEALLQAAKAALVSISGDEHYQEFREVYQTLKKAIALAERTVQS